MNVITDIADLKEKKVLLRVDFDVPVGANGQIQETFRIRRQKETLDYLRDHGAQVTVMAHISAVPSFAPLMGQIQAILGPITLLENLRANPGEEANNPAFAKELATGFDLYVNNAFAVCHREHASVSAITLFLPSYAGLLLKEESDQLSKIITAPAEGTIIYMGGAKASTKVPVIKHLIDHAQAIAVGGVLANDISVELGKDIRNSRVDEDAHELLAGLDLSDSRLAIPSDEVWDDGVISDIGPETAAKFAALASGATLVVWNGPMGKFEDARFMAGTKVVAQAIAASDAFSVIGGGDTISAIDQLGLLDTIGFVSTGGGAMLAFLAGTELPGLKALAYAAPHTP